MGENGKNKDRATLEAIGSIYCKGNHDDASRAGQELCPKCRRAIENTLHRAESCPYGHAGNCEDCETHCQRGKDQEAIRRIMSYAAPRMAFRHPIMTFHYLKKKRKA